MRRKYGFVAAMLSVILLLSLGLTALYTGQEKGGKRAFKIVTSFFPMYVIAENIVGDAAQVSLENLSEPKTGCLHDYQLTPADMKLLSDADVFIVNGGGIESFLADVAAEYPKLQIISASGDIELLESGSEEGEHSHEEEGNAHAWMSVSRYMQLVDTVAGGLAAADTARAKLYNENAKAYRQRLLPLQKEMEALKENAGGGAVVSLHEAYAYVAQDMGLQVAYTLNLDEERQVSAGEVADVLAAIGENGVKFVLAEEIYGKEMGDMLLRETDVRVIYLDTLVRGDYEKNSYLDGMRENIRLLREAFVQ